MNKVMSGGKFPVKIWTDEVEESAEIQLKNLSNLPFVFKHIAVMPDVHAGWGSTIGTVIATDGAVIPSAVGVDIGCGMAALKVKGVNAQMLQGDLKVLRHSFERSVPVSHNGHKNALEESESWDGWGSEVVDRRISIMGKAKQQLGTLGGGNHFIEVCLDQDDHVWLMLHSGSRGIGKKIADIHIGRAKELMSSMFIELSDPDLAYLPAKSAYYKEYMQELMWAQSYAQKNRDIMIARVLKDFYFWLGAKPEEPEKLINCHHNFATMENHFGKNVLVTRKGAVRARKGDWGIIPGSMGTKSYIVQGLGNPDSFNSCSHGAGRVMSRTKARKTFTEADMVKQTEGVECRKDSSVIDEIPGAYKDIDKVMENQKDLVIPRFILKQILCVKG